MVPLIEIRNLNHSYGKGALKKQILFDINLDIYPGEIVLLTGPSGSGKTTLLSLIGGLRSIQDGSLRTADIELNGANEDVLVAVRRHTGYIFQAHNLLPFMTARQNVQMSVELHKNVPAEEAQARSIAALEAVGLGQHGHHYPDKLSGGQKQRVAIARALVNRPKLILADEPTAALDSHTGREVVNLMQQMAREQRCTILLVTHDNRILDIADRIVHLEDGKLQQETASQEGVLVSSTHYASPKRQEVERFIAVERFVSPDFVAPSEHIHDEAAFMILAPESKTELVETQVSSFDQQESTPYLGLQFKTAETNADETNADELTVVELTTVIEPTILQWHGRISTPDLDRIVAEVIQEDFQMYVDFFSLAAETQADESKVDETKAAETNAADLTIVELTVAEPTVAEPTVVRWHELKPVEAKADETETSELAVVESTVVRWHELKTIEAKAAETETAELTVVEPTTSRWHERESTPELDRIVEKVTQEDFQMYVEWFSFRATDELKPTEIYTIACIDDNSTILEVLKSFLSDELFSVVLINDPIKALTQLIRVKPNLIILDITMPNLNGYQLCELLRRHKHFKDLPVIFITGDRRMFNPKEAQKLGVKDCLIKPFNQSDLIVKLFPYLV